MSWIAGFFVLSNAVLVLEAPKSQRFFSRTSTQQVPGTQLSSDLSDLSDLEDQATPLSSTPPGLRPGGGHQIVTTHSNTCQSAFFVASKCCCH